jgi:glycerol-3-phosphate dehydrogenase
MAPLAAGHVEDAHAGTKPMSVPREPGAGPDARGDGGKSQGKRSSRRATLDSLTAERVDLLVIGGGITGTGVARDAAMRGIRTVVVEQRDLACGTSSRSSRLVHGGIRYLEQGHLGLVLEAVRERETLLRIAPHLVRPLDFLFPVHRGDRLPLWKLAAGVGLYSLFARFRNVGRHRVLSKRGTLEAEPMLRERGLTGAVRYTDAQCDDARLVVATARSAIHQGARIANHMRVLSLHRRDGRVAGVVVDDLIEGRQGTIEATVVVNATGPWCDQLRRLEDPTVPALLRPTRGVHVMVARERIGLRHAIAFLSPLDGRVMFVLPWGDLAYIGTTDTDDAGTPDQVRADGDDLVYLLRSANARFPNAHLTEEDVRVTWAGLRPLLAGKARSDTSAVSREHAIVTGPAGMITVAGGKLTTYRSMAAEVVDQVARRLGTRAPHPPTATEPLPGGETLDFESFRRRGAELGLPGAVAEHLVRHYGTEAAGIYNLGVADRALFERLHPAHPALEAEVIHAARRELAMTVEDVLVRRIHLYFETRDRGLRAAPRTAELLGREHGWSEDRIRTEAERYRAFVAAEPRTA